MKKHSTKKEITTPDPIDLKNKGSIERILSPEPARHQPLRGFEEQYTDIVDYIVRITHRIWEEGDMAYIYDTYAHNCTVHTPYGTSYDSEGMVANSVAFLAAIPDRKLFAEDVIWTGDDEAGFISSHLVRSKGTNTGHSPWGPPTGRRVGYFAIANCLVKENRIVEEWLVRDNAGLLRQLGFDPKEVAKQTAMRDPSSSRGATHRLKGQLSPTLYEPITDEVANTVRRFLHDAFNRRRFTTIAETHRADVHMFAPGHTELRGVNAVKAYLLNFVAMFADGAVMLEHLLKIGNERDGYRVAVTWRFAGTHTHNGYFGEPTNKRVDTLAISHLHVKDDKIYKHYLLMDELAILSQLNVARAER